jgi:ABC-type antimicrobial peptide transport system permease subunit
LARLYSKDQPVLGRRLRVANAEREVVGVVGNVQQRMSFGSPDIVPGPITAMPVVYVPASQLTSSFFTLVHQWFRPVWSVRSAGGDAGPILTRAIQSVDPALPVSDIQTIDDVRAGALAEQRLLMSLVGAVALAALALAAMGLYGLIAHTIAERHREFGIRLALGASPLGLVRAAAGPGVALAVVGTVLGAGLSVLAVRLVQSLLWGVTPYDPATYALVLGFLLLVAAVASLWPSMQLLRHDPVRALRD